MKLYIVIYLAGLIGGTIGPLPYDMEECQRRVAAEMAQVDPTITTPNGFSAKDVRLACEWHEVRPGTQPGAGKTR
jgi:hypothetical protein